jgi:cytochrome c-type biogenesis protein CcmH/NrfG
MIYLFTANRCFSMNPLSGAQAPTEVTTERFPKWVILLAGCVLLLLAMFWGRRLFLEWQERHLVRQARVYLQLQNFGSFSRTLGEVRKLNPDNVDACRLYAEAFTRRGDPAALPWLRRVVQLTNGNVDDQLALAEAELDFRRGSEAAKVLQSLQPTAQGRASYHDLAGRLALLSGNSKEAESCFAEALRLAPENQLYCVRLATARLDSRDPVVEKQAQDDLEQLETRPPLASLALRALIEDALKKNRPARAAALAEKLDALPGCGFSDHLACLTVFHQAGDYGFASRLAETQETAAQTPDQILPLVAWMNANQLALLVQEWTQSLPPEMIASTPIRIEIAHAYSSTSSWKELSAFIANDNWGILDYIKNAFLARATRGAEKSDSTSRAAWALALKEAADHSEALAALAQMAKEWGWETELTEVTWQAALHSDQSREATEALRADYFKKRDTAGLLRVYLLLLERNPGDFGIRNNVALFSLLLGKDKERALDMSRELYKKEPANPAYASTYAFALYCKGKTNMALGVMGELKPELLKDPQVAAYYSAMLAGAGRLNEAKEFRDLAKGANLLPEEKQFLETGVVAEPGNPAGSANP